MKQYAALLVMICVVWLSAFGLQAAEYNVYADGSGDFATIQDAIDGVSEGDTIIVHPGAYYENIYFDGKNIILRSEDPENSTIVDTTIINGGAAGSVVRFSGTEDETCELSGFTITNGSTASGGGIYGGGANAVASISHCTITGNSADWGGGLRSCSGTIANCTITDNQANYGGGLYECDGLIQECTVSTNTATQHGAGLYGCNGTIEDCTIDSNSAAGYGGGLAMCQGVISYCTISGNSANHGAGLASNDATIYGCTISNNTAAEYGGGLYYCDATISECSITGNQGLRGGGLADCDGTIHDCNITTNTSTQCGGGVAYCHATIYSCTISTNTAADHGGGLFYCDATIYGCTISTNTASSNGGGLYYCHGTILECEVLGNQSVRGGGLYYCDGTISTCTISNNSASISGGGLSYCDGAISSCTITGNTSAGTGGGIDDCDGTIVGCTISDNSASGNGGGLYGCSATISTCMISGNSGNYGGGLILCYGLIQDCVITGNTGKRGGGVAYCGTILNCTIVENEAITGGGLYNHSGDVSCCVITDNSASGFGGGFYECDGTITSCLISRNTAATIGGLYGCDGTIQACEITHNTATQYGGGLACCDGTIQGCTISGNSAGTYGGGLYDCDGTVSTCTVTDNSGGQGGGLMNCDGTIQGCTISDNSASTYGGGFRDCLGTIASCLITGNTGMGGAGLRNCDGTIQACEITHNTATQFAGGLGYCDGTIHGCTISGNSAGTFGGGLYECDGTVSTCTITDNSGSLGGGLGFCDGIIQGCAISGNSADDGGAGLSYCNGAISSCTIADNSGGSTGGGLYICGGTVTDCVIWGNATTQIQSGSTPTYCCIQDWSGGGEGNISDDPLFVTGPHTDYYLSETDAGQGADSPCIDAGSDTAANLGLDALTTRTDGTTDSGTVDMGCHYDPDATAPQSICDSPEYANPPIINITYDASDTGGSGLRWVNLWFKFDSGDWATAGMISCGETGSFAFWPEDGPGTYCFQTVARDKAGNVEAGPSGDGDSCTLLDEIPPVSECASPTYSTSPEISVSYTASDTGGSGLASVALWYKFGASGAWTDTGLSDDTHSVDSGFTAASFEFTATDGEGIYYFQTIAQDNAWNTEAGPSGDGDDSTTYDETAPSSSCTSPSYANSSPIVVNFTAGDALSGMASVALWYRYDGGSWADSTLSESGTSGSFDFVPGSGDGTYEFYTIATDNAGNEESAPGTADDSTDYDTTAPQSSCTSPEYANSSPIAVSFAASDTVSGISSVALWYDYEEQGWTDSGESKTGVSGSFDFTPPHGDGTYAFYTVATDNAGNLETAPGDSDDSTVYDSTAPQSSCTSPGYDNSSPIVVNFTASDALSGMDTVALWYRYDGGSWADSTLSESGTSGSFDFPPGDGDGTYAFYTVATDNAGNVETAPEDSDDSTVYDSTAPQSSCTSPGYDNTSPIVVSFTASDALSGMDTVALWYRYDGGSWADSTLSESGTSGSFDFPPGDGDGTYEFYTRATDNAGNVETAPEDSDDSTVYDSTAPQSSCTSPGYDNSSPIVVNFTASDALSGMDTVALWYRYDGGSWADSSLSESGTSGSFNFTPPDGNGTYGFYTIATDNASNVEAAPGTADDTTGYDTIAPESICSSSPYSNSSPIAVSFVASDSVSGIDTVALWFSFDSGVWTDSGLTENGTSGGFDFTPTNGDGTYEFYTIAADNVGNVESAPGAADDETVHDTVAPESSCTSPPFANTSPISVDFTASDAVSGIAFVALWYNYEDQGWTYGGQSANDATTGSLDFIPGNGTCEFYTIATDNAGNVEGAPGTADDSTIYDTVAPQSSCTSPEFANTSPITVTFTANDAVSGIASVALWYRYDDGDWADSGLSESGTSGSYAFTPADGDGTYEFYTIANDNAGNVEAAPDTADDSTEYDTIAPESSCSSPPYSGSSPIAMDFTASDSPSSGVAEVALWFNYDEQGWLHSSLSTIDVTSGTLNFAPADGDGTYEFYTVATDNAGNVEAAPDSADDSTEYDTIAPKSSCSSPPYSGSSPIAVDFTASDSPSSGVAEVALWFNYDEQGWLHSSLSTIDVTSGTLNFAPADGDGTYEFYTVATDNAGNVEAAPDSADDSTEYDTIAPESLCSSPTYVNSSPIAVSFTASDSPSSGVAQVSLWFKHEDGEWADSGLSASAAPGSLDFEPTDGDGTYFFQTIAEDNAGNVEAVPSGDGDSSTILDTTAPESSATAPSQVTEAPFTVEFTASDAGLGVYQTVLHYRHDSGTWQDYGAPLAGTSGSFNFTAPDGEGVYEFYTIATDNAANVEVAPSVPDAATGYGVPVPDIDVDRGSLDFGDIAVGASRTLTVVVTNVGDGDLVVTGVSCNASEFDAEIDGHTVPHTLESGNSADVLVSFSPDSPGEFSGVLSIASTDPDEPITTVDLTGTGLADGELQMLISADNTQYAFDEAIQITVGVVNEASTVLADVYVALAYDVGGVGERFWSPVGFDAWTEDIVPWLPNYELPNGLDISVPVWSLPVPYDVPNLAMTGDYTLFVAATEPGTLDFISDIGVCGFSVEGAPFISMAPDAGQYAPGDTISIGLSAEIPGYDVSGDVYLLTMDPSGEFWTPLGTDMAWILGFDPFMPAFTLPAGMSVSLDGLWQIEITAESAPFNALGDYYLFACVVETGTLTQWCDLGMGAFVIE